MGNTISDGTNTWNYGGNNRPISITVPATSTTPATVVQTGINALGQRVSKSVNGLLTRFVYDEAGRLIGEYDGSGQLKSEHVWLNDLPVALVRPQAATPTEQTIDNTATAPAFSVTGTWSPSTSVAGYLGTNYLAHAPGNDAPGAVIVDNTDAGFTVTGTWPASSIVGGHVGTDYRTHEANG
ncbi:MAG: hypothetical protein JNK75_09110, partial [Betaproteobacteria bacterium]|nr:hypothetical protein [Betaproteobacteria bacterium]